MKEVGRRCDRCGFGWYAVRPKGKAPKPRWFDETGAFWTDGQARMARIVSNHDRSERAWQRWQQCANCGSVKVSTDTSKQFRPTPAVAPTQPYYGGPGPGPAPAAEPGPVAGPAPAPAVRNGQPAGPSFGARLAAFHGLHWRVIWAVVFFLAPFGSFGDDGIYGDSVPLNILKGLAVFAGCWAVAWWFLRLHLRRRGPGSSPVVSRHGRAGPPNA